ncbi:MAG: hypothetical protein WB420_12735 [Bradyrhizobium sp.]
MFAHMIDRFKESTASALRLSSLAAAVALALFVAISFLCAAAFVYMLQTYGPIQACLTGAVTFLILALVAAVFYVDRRNRARARAAEAARSAARSALADPMLVSIGIQLIRAIGVKKLIPILAVGGLALGFLASRHAATDEAPAE